MDLDVRLIGIFVFLHQMCVSASELPAGRTSINSEFDGHLLAARLKRLAGEELQLEDAQKIFNGASYKPELIDWNEVKQEMAGMLGTRVGMLKELVEQQKEAIENEFIPHITPCCDLPENATQQPNSKNASKADLEGACIHFPPNTSTSSTQMDQLITAVRASRAHLPYLVRQYAALQNGAGIGFQSRTTPDCDTEDPRTSMWYSQTYSSMGKDIVLILDEQVEDVSEAAHVVLKTLKQSDRVALVVMQNPDDDMHVCKEKKTMPRFVSASRSNIERIQASLSSRITKASFQRPQQYLNSLKRAFAIFEEVQSTSDEMRNKIVLLISNVTIKTEENATGIIRLLRDQTRMYSSGIMFLTYGFGADRNSDVESLLIQMAEESSLINSAHSLKRGHYSYISPGNCSSIIGTYFTNIGHTMPTPQSPSSIITRHSASSDPVLTLCMPIYQPDGMFGGVSCGDMDLESYLYNLTHFTRGIGAYVFLIDSDGNTLVHPLLQDFGDVNNFYDISLFEKVAGVNNIIDSMKHGTNGSQFLHVSLKRTFVGPMGAEIGSKRVTAQYSWTKVPHTDFSLCIVSTMQDIGLRTDNADLDEVNYVPPADVRNQPYVCNNQGMLSTLDTSTVSFTPTAFHKRSSERMTTKESDDYLKLGIKTTETNFKDRVRVDLAVSGKLDTLWKTYKQTEINVLWRYYMSLQGVIRVYPGTDALPWTNNPPWYTEAVSRPGIVTLTNGGGTEHAVNLIISSVVYDNREDFIHPVEGAAVVGVYAGELRSDPPLQTYLFDSLEHCKDQSRRCLLLDRGGYIILHQHLSLTPNKNNHIIAMEPAISKYLIYKKAIIRQTCLDVVHSRVIYKWKLNMMKDREDFQENLVEIVAVPGTNVYLLKINTSINGASSCQPCKPRESDALCRSTNATFCECPCITKVDLTCTRLPSLILNMDLCPVQQRTHRLDTSHHLDLNELNACFPLIYKESVVNVSTSYVESGTQHDDNTVLVVVYTIVAVISIIASIFFVQWFFRNKTQMRKKIRKFQSHDGSEWIVSWENVDNTQSNPAVLSGDDVFDSISELYPDQLNKLTKNDNQYVSQRPRDSQRANRDGSVSSESVQGLITEDNYTEKKPRNDSVDSTGEGTSHGVNYRPSSVSKL